MDVFALRNRIIEEFADYVRSFIHIADPRIQERVARELRAGLLWPDPLIQLNPSFEPGAWIDDLVAQKLLHEKCSEIFRIKDPSGSSKPLRLHKHQAEAIEAARSGDSYVLTTGTGSGKSLAYIVPIVDFVLRQGSGKGIRAIVVYPMNALANSQSNELEKFLLRGFPPGKPPVTFRQYTGQEREEEREEILANPPDILLTNYVMLELMLTRPREQKIVNAARKALQFLVLDELHTYRGRQGADVSLLVRRVRELAANVSLQCVGTSATLAGGGALADQQAEVAGLATRIFGAQVKPGRVIGETLRRASPETDLVDPAFQAALARRVASGPPAPPGAPPTFASFIADPLSIWIESTFGLATEASTGRLKRAEPLSIAGAEGAAARLALSTGLDAGTCAGQIQEALLAGYRVEQPETGFPAFPFRLHQFVSRGDTVYASLEAPDSRTITTQGQQFVPGDRARILLPLAFCRECGQEYYTVSRHADAASGKIEYRPRELLDQSGVEDARIGFLYPDHDNPWPEEAAASVERLPEDWLEEHKGGLRVKPGKRQSLPLATRVNLLGVEDPAGEPYHFVKSPFPLCLRCDVSYGGRERSDFARLTTLTSEGRSTATTVLSLAAIRALRDDPDLPARARKLLSFTDNRQDASLQAGHFNDFVEVAILRGGLCRAVAAAGPRGISHEQLAQRVFEAMALPKDAYAADPTVQFQAARETDRALREVLAYRIYHDLRRGWRVTSPNLEQCALLRIEYASLDELCAAEEFWSRLHPALAGASPDVREKVARVLLDHLRRELAIDVSYLEPVYQEALQQLSSQRLRSPWSIDENESLMHSFTAFPRSKRHGDSEECLFVSERSGFGLFLRRTGLFPNYSAKISTQETAQIIRQLFDTLQKAGLVEIAQEPAGPGDPPGYRVPASALVWREGDGKTPYHDPIRVPRPSSAAARVNPFFVKLYRGIAATLQGMEAREHTAQVSNEDRMEREERFRAAALPVLYCSPTMELGVDISLLNAVNMRNVPPTPANYAQRSGRAGRSGQPALVFTYCTTGSSHDQYFFKRPGLMVSGAVTPPRLDLANEDLLRAHAHAVWLAETGLWLGSSLSDVLDVAGEDPTLALLPSVAASIGSDAAKARASDRLQHILANLAGELADADWYDQGWLDRTLAQAEERFDRACDRWRTLYRAARAQRAVQNKVIGDASRSTTDKLQAKRLRAEAESQMDLLTKSETGFQSDFYSYRYFASEGFLPGYSFPRLPLSAYLPASRRKKSDRDEYLSRPRFLAISEFGPRSIIYHEGSRYLVNKVILPVEEHGEHGLLTASAKLCPRCGYLHPVVEGQADPNNCDLCNTPLAPPVRSLFRMQNVSTRRRDRINSDEEERLRMGYELQTAVRFSGRGHDLGLRRATVVGVGGQELLRLTYGHSATLWRINLGWRRRADPDLRGFVVDTERGYWATNERAAETDPEDPMSPSKLRVIPYVEDWRNCLLVEPAGNLPVEVMASLQPALKNAIQVLYQVEENELAAEPLPGEKERRQILLYEAAEGGAGVLRQVIASPDAFARVAAKALELCHFDPAGNDLGGAPGSRERCEAACYDCLMSYTNQRDHPLLDRMLVRDLLLQLAAGTVIASPAGATRGEHLKWLKAQCDSELERKFLDFLEARNLHLPDRAQVLFDGCHTRADFIYSEAGAVIFVDGPHHDQPDVAAKDHTAEECLRWEAGQTVVRFRYDGDWAGVVGSHPAIFGAAGGPT
jgi:very-short-patch-repair endonuclease